MLILVLSIFFTGCTQLSGTVPGTPAVPVTIFPTPEPATPVSMAAGTSAPREVVTIIHQVSLLKDIKDSEHLFSLQVPEEWYVKTYRLNIADNSEGFIYQTDLVEDNVFYIQTYTASRNQDQAYRDQFRKWSPSPTETTVKINEITYDRFESATDGRISVAYVERKSSANERGYASVIVFVADAGNRFEKEDFENIVASFRYFSGSDAGSMPGEEIARTNRPFKPPAPGSGDCGCGG
jgi:hypothetical protein